MLFIPILENANKRGRKGGFLFQKNNQSLKYQTGSFLLMGYI